MANVTKLGPSFSVRLSDALHFAKLPFAIELHHNASIAEVLIVEDQKSSDELFAMLARATTAGEPPPRPSQQRASLTRASSLSSLQYLQEEEDAEAAEGHTEGGAGHAGDGPVRRRSSMNDMAGDGDGSGYKVPLGGDRRRSAYDIAKNKLGVDLPQSNLASTARMMSVAREQELQARQATSLALTEQLEALPILE